MIRQCKSINCKKCTTLVAAVGIGDAGGGGGGQGGHEKSLYLPLHFALNLKLL